MTNLILSCFVFLTNSGSMKLPSQCVSLKVHKYNYIKLLVSLRNGCDKTINYKIALEAISSDENKWTQILENIANEKQLGYAYSSPLLPLGSKNTVSIKFEPKQAAIYKNKKYKFRFKVIVLDEKSSDFHYAYSSPVVFY